MHDKKSSKILNISAKAAISILAAVCFVKYLLPIVFPFVFALLTARAIEPAVSALNRVGISRCLAAALCSLTVLSAAAICMTLTIWRGIYELSAAAHGLTYILTELSSFLSALDMRISAFITYAPEELEPFLQSSISGFKSFISEIPAKLSGTLLSAAARLASAAPGTALGCATYAAGTFFASSGHPEITHFLSELIPQRFSKRLQAVKRGAVSALAAWFKAQAILAGASFCILLAVFTLIGIEYSVILSLVLSLLDSLPVLGTGTVLVPWAALELLRGNTMRAAVLVGSYVLCSVTRGLLEPRLIGKNLGLHPLGLMFAMYAGFKTFGIWGMLLTPPALLAARQLYFGRVRGFSEN